MRFLLLAFFCIRFRRLINIKASLPFSGPTDRRPKFFFCFQRAKKNNKFRSVKFYTRGNEEKKSYSLNDSFYEEKLSQNTFFTLGRENYVFKRKFFFFVFRPQERRFFWFIGLSTRLRYLSVSPFEPIYFFAPSRASEPFSSREVKYSQKN